jgi:hypothetical protein
MMAAYIVMGETAKLYALGTVSVKNFVTSWNIDE